MPKPTTKSELLNQAEEKFAKMWELINSLSDAEQNATFNYGSEMGKEAHWGRDKNLRDVLIHLYEWHQLFLNWVAANQKGDAKQFLLNGYNWGNYGEMNVEFWKRHQNTPYDESKQMVHNSHAAVIKLINTFNDQQLFTKGAFDWVGGTTLAQYCTSVTSGHYEWAIKKIKAHIKTK